MKNTTKYSLALDFHENTKELPGLQPYDEKKQYKVYANCKAVSLAKNSAEQATDDIFLHTLLTRKSTRAFSSANISLEQLSKLMSLSFGIRDFANDTGLRTYASAGGRFPVEVYVAVMRSDDMERGIYHFNVAGNSLELIKPGDYSSEISDFYSNQEGAITTDYPCIIFFSMIPGRTMEKYGERGYRFVLLDAGHMGQNLYLVATYLGLGAVAIGAGVDSDGKLDDMLGLLSDENVFYSFAVGVPLG